MSIADKLVELQEQKNKLAAEIRSLADKGQGDEGFTPEERTQWETVNAAYDANDEERASYQEKLDIAARAASLEDKVERQASEWKSEIGEARQIRAGNVTEEHRALTMQAWLCHSNGIAINERQKEAAHLCGINVESPSWDLDVFTRSAPTGNQGWDSRGGRGRLESRADTYNSLVDAEGGYTVPEGFVNQLERSMLAYGGVRRVARVISTATGNSLPWPTSDDTANSGALLAEETDMGDTVRVPFSVITFVAYKYSSKPVRISQELLTDSAFNLSAEIGSALGERIGRITESHFTSGTNSGQPQGVEAGSALGVTAAGTAAITADELIDLQDSIDPAYEEGPAVGWMMKKATRSAIRKLKDSNGQYLWVAGLAGEADSLLGKPLTVNQTMPGMTTGLKSVLYGDFSKYIIRDVAGVAFHRLEERYREFDQTGFVMFSRHDGRILDAGTDPIKHLIQA
tara:strand:+ start:1480 stop:2853 length:1374 start_codon:yes stop_codon:yes gene_type:complete